MSNIFKQLFQLDKKPRKGLVALEWAVLVYAALTTVLILVMFNRLHAPEQMLMFRFGIGVMIGIMWAAYRLVPCRIIMLLRIALQIVMLKDWYPDTYEFNRCFCNLDHVFCNWEQMIFGCQPALEFSKVIPWGVFSEMVDFGYVAYYPIISIVTFYYFFKRPQQFQKAAFTVMAAFFIYYVVFIFVPVAGPTFYYKAVGIDQIQQGIFPNIGHYFENHSDLSGDCLPTPGWTGGFFWYMVEVAKWAGERPTAAFPSSHVGVTTVCMLLAWKSRSRKLFYYLLPVAILLFLATVYIQAHYAIDAIAGLISGALIFFALWWIEVKE